MNIINIVIGGLGYHCVTKNPWKCTLFLDSHNNQFGNIDNNVTKIYSQIQNGCGGDMYCGQVAFETVKDKVWAIVKDYDYIVITAGFGGGTGAGFTLGLVDLFKQKSMSYLVVANTLKLEEYYQDSPSNQFDMITEQLDNICPYYLVDSKSIEKDLSKYNLKAREYEIYVSNQNYLICKSIDSILNNGIDGCDFNKLIGNGLCYISVTKYNTNFKAIIDNLFTDQFSKMKARHLDNYILSYPKDIDQNLKKYILTKIDLKINSNQSKIVTNNADLYYLLGSCKDPNASILISDNSQNASQSIPNAFENQQFNQQTQTLSTQNASILISDNSQNASQSIPNAFENLPVKRVLKEMANGNPELKKLLYTKSKEGGKSGQQVADIITKEYKIKVTKNIIESIRK